MTTLTAPSASTLPATIAAKLEEHANAARGAYAGETARALRRSSGAFTAWAAGAGLSALPATPATVAGYVDALAAAGRSPATVRQAVWGVGALHRAGGLEDPSKAEEVQLALRRMARAVGTRQRQAAPVGEDDVRLLLRLIGSSPGELRDLALLLVMRDLLARRSEAVALELADLTFAADGSATALIRRGKTDATGQGEVRWLSPRTVARLRAWLDAAGIVDGPVFRAVNKGGKPGAALTGGDVPRIFKRLAARAGLDPAQISGHSARIGMAQDLVASGAELPAVMQAGRWKSPTMPARYAERLVAGRGAVARFYAGGDGT